MKILVVSGFLGAGKTTFIKNLITNSDKQLVILENEYGQDSLDGKELKKGNDLEVLEFMEGCVCCSKKDTFINTLLTIDASIDPEYLVVEPSGVGKLSNILSGINKILYEKIQILKPVVIVSPRNINEYIINYKDIYIDQISNASIVIFSKIENEPREIIDEAISKIRIYNNDCVIVDSPYQNNDKSFYESLLMDDDSNIEVIEIEDTNKTNVSQYSINDPKINSISELVVLLEEVIHGGFGDIVRAKGELLIHNERVKFDVADGLYGIIGIDDDGSKCECVFIGQNISEISIANSFHIRNRKIDLMRLKNK